MPKYAYHPGIEASAECRRCGRPICENDKRNHLSAGLSGIDERKNLPGTPQILCPLCVTLEESEDSSAVLIIMSLIGIAYLVILVASIIKGRVIIFGSVLVLVILGVITALLFAVALLGRMNGNKSARADMLEFLKTIKWETPGDANVTVNRLLELAPEKLKVRADEIYRRITADFPDAGPRETAMLKKSLESSEWTMGDLGVIFTYFKKNIEYWSWRADLTEASKNRVAVAFTYLAAVRHIGKDRAMEIFKNAPPGFVQADMLPQLFENFREM